MSDIGKVQVEINYETVANIHVSHVAWHRIVPVEVERNNQNCFQMCVFGSLWRSVDGGGLQGLRRRVGFLTQLFP